MDTYILVTDLSWIEVKGPDARKFLNGLLTNDINPLQDKAGCYSLMLTPKGKIIADLFCYPCEDHFGIVCEGRLKETILNHLKKYIVFQKVEVVDESEKWGALSVLGPEVLEPAWGDPTTCRRAECPLCGHGRWWGDLQIHAIPKNQWGLPCHELWTHREKIPDLKAKLNLPALTKDIQETLRIESGTPLFGVDFDETTIPQEANLYPALSFTKGCYVGQEIVARLEHRGHVSKQLRQFHLTGKTPPSPKEKIFSPDDQEIGFVTSSCFSDRYNTPLALGYLRYGFHNLPEVKIGQAKVKVQNLVNNKVFV